MSDMPGQRVDFEFDVFDQMTETVDAYLEEQDLPELQRQALVSLVCAGGEAASIVYGEYEQRLRLFGELDEAKARRFATPFILAMASRFATKMNVLYPDDLQRPALHEEYTQAVLRLFALDFARHRQEAEAIDLQYLHDTPLATGAHSPVEGMLLLSLAARNIGATFGWPVRTPPLPVDNLEALRRAGWREPLGLAGAVDGAVAIADALALAEDLMWTLAADDGLVEYESP